MALGSDATLGTVHLLASRRLIDGLQSPGHGDFRKNSSNFNGL
jgi:hypothetical protein